MAKTGQILKDALDTLNGRQEGFALNPDRKALDSREGGLHGILPGVAKVVDGVVYGKWISDTPETSGTVHVVLLDYPKMFDLCGSDSSKILRGKLSNIISLHLETLEGVVDNITWDFSDDLKIGGTGESIHDAVKATLAPTEPTMTFTEKLGGDIRNIFTFIGRYAVLDPYTQTSLAHLLPSFVAGMPWTLDMKSFSILVYEVDATGYTVMNAQIVANMMARNNGEYTLKKDLNSPKEVKKYSIPFTGFGVRGVEIIRLAQSYVNDLMKNSKDALLSKALYQGQVDELSPNVIKSGLKNSVSQL